MLVVRPMKANDLDALETFAFTAYTGITSLPKSRKLLQHKIDASVKAFDKDVSDPCDEAYYFILEDTEHQTFAGTCAIYARSGCDEPLYFYRLETEKRYSEVLGVHTELHLLRPVSYQPGPTELASLYLMPDYRKGGLGRLLSLSRFLFMTCHPHRFTDTIMAQMRGVILKKYYAPFWEHFGRHYIDLDFSDAMRRLSTKGKDFIPDCLPDHPICRDLLHPEARRVIGKPHPNTRPALAMLEKEGFSFAGEVDIFDAGPKITCPRKEIRTIRESTLAEVEEVINHDINGQRLMISSTGLSDFRACFGHVRELGEPGRVAIPHRVAEALQIDKGAQIQYVSPFPNCLDKGANHGHDAASLHRR